MSLSNRRDNRYSKGDAHQTVLRPIFQTETKGPANYTTVFLKRRENSWSRVRCASPLLQLASTPPPPCSKRLNYLTRTIVKFQSILWSLPLENLQKFCGQLRVHVNYKTVIFRGNVREPRCAHPKPNTLYSRHVRDVSISPKYSHHEYRDSTIYKLNRFLENVSDAASAFITRKYKYFDSVNWS